MGQQRLHFGSKCACVNFGVKTARGILSDLLNESGLLGDVCLSGRRFR
jgi:hypothetical protein